MAKLCFYALIALLSLRVALSADPPQISPGPAPELASNAPSPIPPLTPTPSPLPAPANAPLSTISSPPAPPPSDAAPASSPSASPSPPSPSPSESPVPSPAPASSSDINHSDITSAGNANSEDSSAGMSAGKKLGITVAVIVCAGLVVLAGMIYKKRRDNIRRSEYSYAARREIL